MDLKDIYSKISNYCSYQERSENTVIQKLKKWGVPLELFDTILNTLKNDGYLDNQRFTDSFTRGKTNQKKWGKIKIQQYLLHNKISKDEILSSLEKIDPSDYKKHLLHLMQKKDKTVKSTFTEEIRKQKIFMYLLNKGYEYDLIKEIYKEFKDNEE